LHPLLVIAIFVVVFLEIHPFQDGNGRLSRILTTLMLLQADYAYVPYASLESVIEQSKESYYLALRQTQATIRSERPDWQPWILFFLKALDQQKNRLATKIEREKIVITQMPKLSGATLARTCCVPICNKLYISMAYQPPTASGMTSARP
jgi:Fic family protein